MNTNLKILNKRLAYLVLLSIEKLLHYDYIGEGNGTPLQTEEPGGLQSIGSLRVGHDWATSLSLSTFHALEKEMATHSSVLAWRIPGTGEPGGLPFLGSHRVRHDWSNLAAAAAAVWLYRFSLRNFNIRKAITIILHLNKRQKILYDKVK